MTATELNFRLLKGAIDMREDEKRWHYECFGELGVSFPVHRFHNIEHLPRYWIANDLLPEGHILVPSVKYDPRY